MIANCEGCEAEFGMICEYIEQGFHVATLAGEGLFDKGHLHLIVVDDDGELVAW